MESFPGGSGGEEEMAIRIQIRRDTSDNWSNVNPILAQGELGYEIDTGKLKIGDGTTPWNDLPYFGGGGESLTPGGEDGSIQYKSGTGITGNQYLKWDETNYSLVIDNTSVSGIPADSAPLHIISQTNYGIIVEKNSSSFILIKGSGVFNGVGIHLQHDDNIGTIGFDGLDLALSTPSYSGSVIVNYNLRVTRDGKLYFGNPNPDYRILFENTETTLFKGDNSNFIIGKDNLSGYNDYENIGFGVYQGDKFIFHGTDYTVLRTPTNAIPDNPPLTDGGMLYVDQSTKHLMWKLSNTELYDLCAIKSPAGPDGAIQFKDGTEFAGADYFIWNDTNKTLTLNPSVTNSYDPLLSFNKTFNFTNNIDSSLWAVYFRMIYSFNADNLTATSIISHLTRADLYTSNNDIVIDTFVANNIRIYQNSENMRINYYHALWIQNMIYSSTIKNAYMIRIGGIQNYNAPPETYYAIYQEDNKASSYFAGKVGINELNPQFNLDVNGFVRYNRIFSDRTTKSIPSNTSSWYRIAQLNKHGSSILRVLFNDGTNFGVMVIRLTCYSDNINDITFELIDKQIYGVCIIPSFRILVSSSNDTRYFDMQVNSGSDPVVVIIEKINIDENNWDLIPPTQSGIPSGYNYYIYEIKADRKAIYYSNNVEKIIDDRKETNLRYNIYRTSPINSDDFVGNIAIEHLLEIYDDLNDSGSLAGIVFFNSYDREVSGLYAYNSGSIELRIVSTGEIILSAGSSNIYSDTLNYPAILRTDGTLTARFFRPTSGYKSVAGNAGITVELHLKDADGITNWNLQFQNGLLISASSSS